MKAERVVPGLPSGPVVRVFCHYAAASWLLPLDKRELCAVLEAMLEAADTDVAPAVPMRVELHVLDDVRMSAANRRHMACEGPTNVLSFPGGGPAPGVLLFSADTLRRECLLYGQEPVEHAVRLLAHGMAHLTGLDHGPVMDALCQRLVAAAQQTLEC